MINRLKNFKVFFRDKNKKNYFKIVKELIHFAYVKKELPIDYFRKYLYRKNINDYTNYLSLKEYYSIIDSKKILVPEIASLLDNKLSFAFFTEKTKIPTPKLISYNIKNITFYNASPFPVSNKSDLINFFSLVYNNAKTEDLFLKPIDGIGGYGCILLNKNKLEEQIMKNGDQILSGNYIHQEKISQHDAINTIHANSVNTLRVNTYLDKKGECYILSALMRFGSGNSITDNVSSGGFYVAVNIEEEILEGVGKQGITSGGDIYEYHPNSNIKLNGYKLPYIKEAINTAKLAALKTPTRIIGWDIAITNEGPVIIEGNTNPSLHMADITYGGYCKHPIIKEILKDVNS